MSPSADWQSALFVAFMVGALLIWMYREGFLNGADARSEKRDAARAHSCGCFQCKPEQWR